MRNDRKSVRASAAHLEKRRDDVGDLGGGGGADEGTCGEGKGARIAPKTAPQTAHENNQKRCVAPPRSSVLSGRTCACATVFSMKSSQLRFVVER